MPDQINPSGKLQDEITNVILSIIVNENGQIVDWEKSMDHNLPIPTKKGVMISDFDPIFEGLFPVEKDVIIPHVLYPDNLYVDIHIYKYKRITAIRYIDSSDSAKQILDLVKGLKLSRPMDDAPLPDKIDCEALVGTLDYSLFIQKEDRYFFVSDVQPQWLEAIFAKRKIYEKLVDITIVFPFLESQIGPHTIYNQTPRELPVWTETVNNKEIYLKGYKLRFQNKNLLIIQKFSSFFDDSPFLIQKAREKQLEYEKLIKSEENLKKLIHLKNQFVSVVSHDLRSPLSALLKVSELLTREEDFRRGLTEDQIYFLSHINSEVQVLLDYIDTLYNWSYLEFGKVSLKRTTHKLADLVTSSLNLFIHRLSEKGIRLNQDISPEIMVNVDKTLFIQLLNNLLNNAIKFTPNGGKIEVISEEDHAQINLIVRDTGVGIPKEKQYNLFADFYHDTTFGTSGEKGSGLGLSIVKRIIDLHNFQISVHSEPGKGTTFTITIPAAS
ncbi:MAG: HAMP domain-containing histidine kinase [Bacteroidales bacterium]|nr:HAMP domain-containing histidine kinase [Bacteroidales bacterium]